MHLKTSLLCLTTTGLLAFAAVSGCGSSDTTSSSTSSNSNSNGSTVASNVSSSTGQGAAGSGGGSSSSGSGGATGNGGSGGMPVAVRFVALGDGGEGNSRQLKVAGAVKAECDARGGCDFALYLGDNFYDSGVDSIADTQFQTKFETPYAELSFPFYVVLGNHDYGGGGLGLTFSKGQHQIDYSAQSTKFMMPSAYYKFNHASVDFFGLDTNRIFFSDSSDQEVWINNEITASTANWKIAFGHHTYISNGKHGNAGDYDYLTDPIEIHLIPPANGKYVQDFIDDHICGKADVYICGHDHNRQWLEPQCGTHFIVSGTAAKYTELKHIGTPTKFEKDDSGGYVLVEIAGNTFTAWFYNEDGVEEYSDSFTK